MKTFFASFQKRNSSVELARFLAIGFIIIGHCCVFSGLYPNQAKDPFGHGIFFFHDMLSQVGNGLFISILAFYLFFERSAAKPTWKRIISLYLPCLFYTWVLFGIFIAQGNVPNDTVLRQTHWPILYNNYWFVRAYLIFLLVYPLYYKMLSVLTVKQHGFLAAVFFITIMAIGRHGDKLWGFIGAMEFLCFFTVIGFFKRVHPAKPKRWYIWVPLALLCIAAVFGYVMMCEFVEPMKPYLSWMNNCVSLLLFPTCIVLFYAFLSLPEFHCGPLNYLGHCTFGIYLINGNTCNIQVWMGSYTQFLAKDHGVALGILFAWLVYMGIGLAAEAVRLPLFEIGRIGIVGAWNHTFGKKIAARKAKKEAVSDIDSSGN